ncbi:NAD(P)/FAD-dependent oxidoreductase [Zhengella mangrovi]|uniref:NAD(P)/FAD-dependent oxidoreductase n=1 Tax=Zhengella mangrovi TaxID=1982044 RepID=UPI0013FE33E3|nr:FAD-dependent oxidoreductase [Zhengella mangrovi]
MIVGAGIVGLWCALKAARRGLHPLVLDAGEPGRGGSNGHLGALMPHQPVNWSPKKQAQLDGLLSLEREIAELEAKTGLSCGYRRTGRIVPLTSAAQRDRNALWAAEAGRVWPRAGAGGPDWSWRVVDRNPAPGWIGDDAGPFGFSVETFTARLAPRRLVHAVQSALAGRADLAARCPASGVEQDGTVLLANGGRVRAGTVIVAAGWQSFGLVAGLPDAPSGAGVKGQSALLRPVLPVDPALPVLYDEGVYAIAHDDGLVAVGSTSEKQWSDARETDGRLEQVIARARNLSPALVHAPVVERWAGIRPKGPSASPVVQRLGAGPVILATGGFKITFAVAHAMADAALGLAWPGPATAARPG